MIDVVKIEMLEMRLNDEMVVYDAIVGYDYFPAEPATHDYPGHNEEIEVTKISLMVADGVWADVGCEHIQSKYMEKIGVIDAIRKYMAESKEDAYIVTGDKLKWSPDK